MREAARLANLTCWAALFKHNPSAYLQAIWTWTAHRDLFEKAKQLLQINRMERLGIFVPDSPDLSAYCPRCDDYTPVEVRQDETGEDTYWRVCCGPLKRINPKRFRVWRVRQETNAWICETLGGTRRSSPSRASRSPSFSKPCATLICA